MVGIELAEHTIRNRRGRLVQYGKCRFTCRRVFQSVLQEIGVSGVADDIHRTGYLGIVGWRSDRCIGQCTIGNPRPYGKGSAAGDAVSARLDRRAAIRQSFGEANRRYRRDRWRAARPADNARQILARAVVENACRSKGLFFADKDNRRRRLDDNRGQASEADGADRHDQVDAGSKGNRSAARRILADDIPSRHGRARRGRYRADVQADPANCTLGRGLGLSDDVGNRGCLRSRGNNQTDCRACRNTCSRGYPLADHLSHRHGITCRGNNRAGRKPCARQNRLRRCLGLADHAWARSRRRRLRMVYP